VSARSLDQDSRKNHSCASAMIWIGIWKQILFQILLCFAQRCGRLLVTAFPASLARQCPPLGANTMQHPCPVLDTWICSSAEVHISEIVRPPYMIPGINDRRRSRPARRPEGSPITPVPCYEQLSITREFIRANGNADLDSDSAVRFSVHCLPDDDDDCAFPASGPRA
jgi:hypothetical protein